jgi:hypothetical protein
LQILELGPTDSECSQLLAECKRRKDWLIHTASRLFSRTSKPSAKPSHETPAPNPPIEPTQPLSMPVVIRRRPGLVSGYANRDVGTISEPESDGGFVEGLRSRKASRERFGDGGLKGLGQSPVAVLALGAPKRGVEKSEGFEEGLGFGRTVVKSVREDGKDGRMEEEVAPWEVGSGPVGSGHVADAAGSRLWEEQREYVLGEGVEAGLTKNGFAKGEDKVGLGHGSRLEKGALQSDRMVEEGLREEDGLSRGGLSEGGVKKADNGSGEVVIMKEGRSKNGFRGEDGLSDEGFWDEEGLSDEGFWDEDGLTQEGSRQGDGLGLERPRSEAEKGLKREGEVREEGFRDEGNAAEEVTGDGFREALRKGPEAELGVIENGFRGELSKHGFSEDALKEGDRLIDDLICQALEKKGEVVENGSRGGFSKTGFGESEQALKEEAEPTEDNRFKVAGSLSENGTGTKEGLIQDGSPEGLHKQSGGADGLSGKGERNAPRFAEVGQPDKGLAKPAVKEEGGKRTESVISELWGQLGLLNFTAALEDGDALKLPKSDFAVGSDSEQGLAGAETGVNGHFGGSTRQGREGVSSLSFDKGLRGAGMGLGTQIGALTRLEKEEVPFLGFDQGLRRAELAFGANKIGALARPGGREEDNSEKRCYTELHPTSPKLMQSAGSPLSAENKRFVGELAPDPRLFVNDPPPAKKPRPLLARKPLLAQNAGLSKILQSRWEGVQAGIPAVGEPGKGGASFLEFRMDAPRPSKTPGGFAPREGGTYEQQIEGGLLGSGHSTRGDSELSEDLPICKSTGPGIRIGPSESGEAKPGAENLPGTAAVDSEGEDVPLIDSFRSSKQGASTLPAAWKSPREESVVKANQPGKNGVPVLKGAALPLKHPKASRIDAAYLALPAFPPSSSKALDPSKETKKDASLATPNRDLSEAVKRPLTPNPSFLTQKPKPLLSEGRTPGTQMQHPPKRKADFLQHDFRKRPKLVARKSFFGGEVNARVLTPLPERQPYIVHRQPSIPEVVALAAPSCCKWNYRSRLEAVYTGVPEASVLNAVRQCEKAGRPVSWPDKKGCPNGCKRTFERMHGRQEAGRQEGGKFFWGLDQVYANQRLQPRRRV